MSGTVLILRPEPGASASADRARVLGLHPIVAPLFTIAARPWVAPDAGDYDALLLTSANAVRMAADRIRHFLRLPCYAVGLATAAAARDAGFQDIRSGSKDGAAILATAKCDGARRLLHLTGRDHVPLSASGVEIDRRTVYAADPVPALPQVLMRPMEEGGSVALLHSPRAAALFASLADAAGASRVSNAIVAISAAAAQAAGSGWRVVAAAPEPRDQAMLELAAKLCNSGSDHRGATG